MFIQNTFGSRNIHCTPVIENSSEVHQRDITNNAFRTRGSGGRWQDTNKSSIYDPDKTLAPVDPVT